jgi:hypothetical protein
MMVNGKSELYIKVCLTKVAHGHLPDKWGISFHSYGHGRKMRCPPCTFAKASASYPFPWALQRTPRGHTNNWRNIQEHDEQQRSTMVVFVYLLMQGNAQWTCTVLFPPSSHVHCQLYKSETCHNLLNTCTFRKHFHKSQIRNKGMSGKWTKLISNWTSHDRIKLPSILTSLTKHKSTYQFCAGTSLTYQIYHKWREGQVLVPKKCGNQNLTHGDKLLFGA